jgi:hypothetical protein
MQRYRLPEMSGGTNCTHERRQDAQRLHALHEGAEDEHDEVIS